MSFVNKYIQNKPYTKIAKKKCRDAKYSYLLSREGSILNKLGTQSAAVLENKTNDNDNNTNPKTELMIYPIADQY